MDVLFLSQRVPFPPDRGDRITTYHFLRHYAMRGDRLRIGCFSESLQDVRAADELADKLRQLGAPEVMIDAPRLNRSLRKATSLRALLTGDPLTIPFFRHGGLAGTVRNWLGDRTPDIAHVYSSSMAQYVLEVPAGTRRLMQFAELDSDKWRQYADAAGNPLTRWIYSREAQRLLAFEADVARRFAVSFVCSPVEKDLFQQRIPDAAPPVVLPNGVDVDHFEMGKDAARDPHTLIFTGVMDYEPNVDGIHWFVEACWPQIRAEFRDAKLLVVGSRPIASVKALDGRDGITVTGRVPETPPYFDRAGIAIAPLRLARGVQNKVLEAMSMGLPVVSTPQASQGIEQPDSDSDQVLLVAESAEATIGSILGLMREPESARRLGDRAAAYVRATYRWESMFDRLDQVLAQP